jgi:hypothetical protein
MAIPWLADVLRQAGVTVVEEGDWRSRGVSGSFAAIGVLLAPHCRDVECQ